MNVEKELQHIIEYQNFQLPKHERKTEQAIQNIVRTVSSALQSKTYDFSQTKTIKLKKNQGIRIVKQYDPFSCESVLCIYLKRLLDKNFHVIYPNRNSFMRSLFDITNSLKDMSDYSIFKFDFAVFFNSVSSEYVFEKYIAKGFLERDQISLLKDFVYNTHYAYAGLNTSNIICEIAASHFDDLLQQLSDCGVIYYKRYIDDGIIIFNRYISQVKCNAVINQVIQDIFYDPKISETSPCLVQLNSQKVKYIAKRNISGASTSFDFLGYEFRLTAVGEKTSFLYGITDSKIDKYTKRIDEIVKEYKCDPTHNVELLRHKIRGFCFRTVYQITPYKTSLWKSKGFISNYCELRYRMSSLTSETEKFLKTVVYKCFIDNCIKPPYFLGSQPRDSIYCLYNSLPKYKTLLCVENIGINYNTIVKMCKQVGIDTQKFKHYDSLVREYLIMIKVGH